MIGDRFQHTLQAARSGAEWAWTAIYRDLSPSVLGYLRARGASEAEDITGEVFLQLVRDLGRFDGDEHAFRAWVFVITHHRLADEQRGRARRPVVPVADVPDVRQASAAEDEALAELSNERVRLVLGGLAPDQQAVLLLRVVARLTVDEVARVVGKRPGAVKALQRRGLRAVERALAEEGVPL